MTGGTTPVRATFWLLDAPDSLDVQSRANPDGTGLGIFDSQGAPQLFRQPLAADEDLDFAREARDLESTTWVGHVRHATQGSVALRNSHPFTQDGRIFAHNGGVGDVTRLEQELGDDLALVEGDTDSERVFALVTREIRRRGDIGDGLVAGLSWAAETLPVLALNVVLNTPDELWAVRYPETHSLFLLASDEGPVTRESDAGTRLTAEDAPPHVVVASERLDDDAGWEELEPGELVHVRRDLSIERRVALPDAPARRLSL
jgi:predicted glutamine amidotransferase